MSLSRLKEIAAKPLVALFQSMINNEIAFEKWHGKLMNVDLMREISAEVKQELIKLQQANKANFNTLLPGIFLQIPQEINAYLEAAQTEDEFVTRLIEKHKKYAMAKPNPTLQHLYEQKIEQGLRAAINEILEQALLTPELQTTLSSHIKTQELATNRDGTRYQFGLYQPAANRPSTKPDYAPELSRSPSP